MRVAVLLLLILIPLKGLSAGPQDARCDNELKELKSFSAREVERLNSLLERVKSDIATLPNAERVRANVLWVEADASRRELRKYLESPHLSTLPCTLVNEDIRARLFRAQEFGYQVYFAHDDRAQFTADRSKKN